MEGSLGSTISHKTILFVSISVYFYIKYKKLSVRNMMFFKFLDQVLLLFIYKIKDQKLYRFIPLLLLNYWSGGTTKKTLSEDFFFSSSGSLFISYFI